MLKQGVGSELDVLQTEAGQRYTLLPAFKPEEGAIGPSALLGKGSFGEVSIGLTEIDGEIFPVAVKKMMLDKTASNYEKTLAEVQKEIRLMNKLNRRSELVKIESNAQPNQVTLYVIQPLIRGKELTAVYQELAKKAQVAKTGTELAQLQVLKEYFDVTIAAFKAAQEIQNYNIIHGDLHTGNILWDSVTATAFDFGLSHELSAGQKEVYVEGEYPLEAPGLHIPPEASTPQKIRSEKAERIYDLTTDGYSLAMGCGVYSDVLDYGFTGKAGKQIDALAELLGELSKHPELVGKKSADRTQRISLAKGIARLERIQYEVSKEISQQMANQEVVNVLRRSRDPQVQQALRQSTGSLQPPPQAEEEKRAPALAPGASMKTQPRDQKVKTENHQPEEPLKPKQKR